MAKKIFITGTDTEMGKTTVACHFLRQLACQGYQTIGLKPVSSGCEMTPAGLRNSDALQLQAAATIKLPYQRVNPVAFQSAIAPHIAAKQQGVELSVTQLTHQCQPTLNHAADYIIVEGVGGWLTPLNDRETMADFARQWCDAVILVVGMRLGCLNHALLTWEALQIMGMPCLGWVANCLQPDMACLADNMATLQTWLPVPCLGVMTYQGDTQDLQGETAYLNTLSNNKLVK